MRTPANQEGDGMRLAVRSVDAGLHDGGITIGLDHVVRHVQYA
jgi:hypothetical protein